MVLAWLYAMVGCTLGLLGGLGEVSERSTGSVVDRLVRPVATAAAVIGTRHHSGSDCECSERWG